MRADRSASTHRALPGRAPDFFVIGHAKSGTTALYQMLRAHPQIYMPELKETLFFARELHPRSTGSDVHPDTLEEYLALFDSAKPDQRVGEASPSYIRSRTAAAQIAELRPDARIIAILREPASFVLSLHLQLLQAQVENEKDLGKALALEPDRRRARAGGSPIEQGLLYAEHVRYVEQLRCYEQVFPSDHMHVVIYDDFRADNEATVRELLRFLEVDDALPIAVTEANPSVAVRSPRLYRLVRSLQLGSNPAMRGAREGIKAVTPRQLRHEALALQRRLQWGTPGAPDDQLMRELRRRFKGEVLALSEHLERDLVTLWGYGDDV